MSETHTGWWRGPGGGAEVMRLAWPLVLSSSFTTLQIVIDRILLGQHDSDEVGSAIAAVMYFWTPLTLVHFTVNYVTSFVAQYRGAGQPERVGPALWQALYLAVLFGLAFLLMHPLGSAIVAWGDHAPEQQRLEVAYFECLCFAAPAFLLNAVVSGYFTGLGHSFTVLVVNGVGLAINCGLGILWIFGHAGFPEMGIVGAGWATVVSSCVAALLGLCLVWRRSHREAFATLAGWRLDPAMMGRLLRFGLPNGVVVTLETLAFGLFVTFVGRMGKVELNATSVATTLNLLAYLPIVGVAQATGTLVSKRLGEERPDLAERSAWSGLRLALGLAACLVSLFLIVPGWLVELFGSKQDAEYWDAIAALARELLYFVVAYALFDAASLVFSFSLRGAGDTIFVSLATLLAAFLIMVLPAWMSAEEGWGVYTAWAFASAFPMACATLFCLRFRQGSWRALRIIEQRAEESIQGRGGSGRTE